MTHKYLWFAKLSSSEPIGRLKNAAQIAFQRGSNLSDQEMPVACHLSKFHATLVYPGSIVVVSLISHNVVYSRSINERNIVELGFDKTNHHIYLVSKEAPIYVAKQLDDSLDAWKQFLAAGMIKEANLMCRSSVQKEFLSGMQAEQLFTQGDFVASAKKYALSNRKFEEVCLKFLTARQLEGLEAYLVEILERMKQKLRVDLIIVKRSKVDPAGAQRDARSRHQNHRTLICNYIIELKLSILEEAEQALAQTEFKLKLNSTKPDATFRLD